MEFLAINTPNVLRVVLFPYICKRADMGADRVLFFIFKCIICSKARFARPVAPLAKESCQIDLDIIIQQTLLVCQSSVAAETAHAFAQRDFALKASFLQKRFPKECKHDNPAILKAIKLDLLQSTHRFQPIHLSHIKPPV